MNQKSPFRYFKTSPEIIRLAVMYYVRYPLSLRSVEDILHERGIDVSHETVRYWWNRFGPLFANQIKKRRIRDGYGSKWRWHLDEVFVKINGEQFYLWRAIDKEGEVLEAYVSTRRNKAAALTFLRKALRRYGNPDEIVTDKCPSYGAALRELNLQFKQNTGQYLNNLCELSHQPFRRRERAMQGFRRWSTLQKFAAIQSSVYNHFNQERHFHSRVHFKRNRDAALNEWRELYAG
jgi:putative transposase